VAQIYSRLGCTAECGRCARTIKAIINEAAATTLVAQKLAKV
jgi:bacterioferritin-associated ferredoxin